MIAMSCARGSSASVPSRGASTGGLIAGLSTASAARPCGRGRAGSGGGGAGARGPEAGTGGFLPGDAVSSRPPRTGPPARAGEVAADGFGAVGAGAGFPLAGSRKAMFSPGRREGSPLGGSGLLSGPLGRAASLDRLRSRTRGGGRSPLKPARRGGSRSMPMPGGAPTRRRKAAFSPASFSTSSPRSAAICPRRTSACTTSRHQ